MPNHQWHFERSGQAVGPLEFRELKPLLDAGVIQEGTTLISPEGIRIAAADAMRSNPGEPSSPLSGSIEPFDRPPPPPPLPPPPPPPPQFTISISAEPPPPWNPCTIGWLGLIFSPVWAGVMAAINARRLGMDTPVARPILIGLASLGLYLLVNSTINIFVVNLAIYVGGILLIWSIDLGAQMEPYDRQLERRGGGLNWVLPTLAGLPAALLVLLVLVAMPLLSRPAAVDAVGQTAQSLEAGDGTGSSYRKYLLPARGIWYLLDDATTSSGGKKVGAGILALLAAIIGGLWRFITGASPAQEAEVSSDSGEVQQRAPDG